MNNNSIKITQINKITRDKMKSKMIKNKGIDK